MSVLVKIKRNSVVLATHWCFTERLLFIFDDEENKRYLYIALAMLQWLCYLGDARVEINNADRELFF